MSKETKGQTCAGRDNFTTRTTGCRLFRKVGKKTQAQKDKHRMFFLICGS